jgi:hypothetical protein
MNIRFDAPRWLAALAVLLAPAMTQAAKLVEQVNHCKQVLQVTALIPAGSCFAPASVYFDSRIAGPSRLSYFRLSDQVDALVHCENINEPAKTLKADSKLLVLIHRRDTGATCVFNRKHPNYLSAANKTTPNFPAIELANSAQNSTADAYWQRPPGPGNAEEAIANNDNCFQCHKASGPYVIGNSAQAMQTFGLINNHHDTHNDRYTAVDFDLIAGGIPSGTQRVAVEFDPNNGTCGGACHNFNPEHADNPGDALPSLMDALAAEGIMPPSQSTSPYRWINRDHPWNGTGDVETRATAQQEFPHFTCANPTRTEAHIQGFNNVFRSDQFAPDRVRTFNMRDGLQCVNADNTGGRTCRDYQTRYLCKDNSNNTEYWSSWYNVDSPSNGGDYENRSSYQNLCTKGPSMAIQARWNTGSAQSPVWSAEVWGPNDRLAQFDNQGLQCVNSSQGSGQTCQNYVVRFICP